MANHPSRANTAVLAVLASACVLALCTGCRRNLVDADRNQIPRAFARSLGLDGMPLDQTANGGLGPIYPIADEPVEVTLDATGSTDVDGRIVSYRWLSATLTDGGVDRLIPEDQGPEWPVDTAQPTVVLYEGEWSFSLWVTDDDGALSRPSSITLIVGDPPEPEVMDGGMPAVMCLGMVCEPMVTLPGAAGPSPGCCDMDTGGACGAIVSMMGECEAVDQPGVDDPSCPSEMSVAATTLTGCCKADGKCGVRSATLRGCIERTDYPPAFLMSMTQLTAADCM